MIQKNDQRKLRSHLKVLVLTGDGINCERETAQAFSEYGVSATIIHIYDLIHHHELLKEAHILALPGGFSFGDELGSGQILALKLKYSLGDELKKFIDSGKLIIGICNGFQALVRLGLLPKPFSPREMSLTHNTDGHFVNRWVDLVAPVSKCVWSQKIQGKSFALPIRHGEGKIVFKGDASYQASLYQTLLDNEQVALTYVDDVNGSYQKIAGICDPTGRIFGLMPHPEAAISEWLNPEGAKKSGAIGIGASFFESGIEYCEKHFL